MRLRRVCALIAMATALAGLSRVASAADLTVEIDDIRNDAGVVTVSLYDSARTWLIDGKSIADKYPRAHIGRVETVFHDLKPGPYAVVVMHDENMDNQMDYNFFGLPKKGYAFSQNVRPFLSSPSFAHSAFTLTPAGGVIEIRMVYP